MTERRAALVTGAASGIGRAIAERLQADGWDVLAADVRPDERGPGSPLAVDLTTRAGNEAAVAAALERYGRLDAVVASAGFQHVAPLESFPDEQWDGLLALLLTSPFLLAKHAWAAFSAAGDGRFLAVASVHGLVGSPFKAGYVAAKHGLLGLVKVLALEGASRGISVSALCPGYVRTPLVERQLGAQAAAHAVPVERVLEDVLLAPQAVKRLLEPAEVAEAAAFLLGPAGRAVTGAPLVLDLGWTAR
ncbi:MAG TPA: SDR family oxidoreductase [Gaiellaceae bacterium]|nr:SDR family oxidoreductase [Gaiellaceae bacterium]